MIEDTLSKCRVLLAEDEYLVAEELQLELEDAGAIVLGPVARIDDALTLIARESKIDGAILDVNLSGEMVYEVADLLSVRGVPFVFTTGYDVAAIPSRFEQITRCEKPTDMLDVVQAIGRAIRSR